MNTSKIVPAILSNNIDEYIKLISEFSKFSEKLHIDIMDGDFVESKSPDLFEILHNIKEINVNKHIHLMVKHPENFLNRLGSYDSQIKLVYIHVDTINSEIYSRLLSLKFPFKIGFTFDPRTNFEKYSDFLSKTEVIQIMTVNPGSQNGDFIPEQLEKINVLKNKYNFSGEIHIDGGINLNTIEFTKKYSIDLYNVGSAIQKSNSPEDEYNKLIRYINN